jgi:hypothetical protein
MFDDNGKILTPQKIFELAKTKEGRHQVAEYIWRARTAMAAQKVMETLGVIPDATTQHKVCEDIWQTIFRVDIFKIMDYAQEIAEFSEGSDIDCITKMIH